MKNKDIAAPKISVIIPLYNTENYIEETLHSILNQTFSDIEVIIVNDGSTDRSLEIVNSIKDNRIIAITQLNQGQSVARNRGYTMAKGDYIYFMDSDDILSPDTFARCYEKNINDDLDFVFFNAEIFGDENHIFPPNNYIRSIADDMVYSGIGAMRELIDKRQFSVQVCLNLIKKEYIERTKLCFLPGFIHEDELFTYLLYARATRVAFINEAFFKRRIRPNSVMSSNIKFHNVECYNIMIKEIINFSKNQSNEIKTTTDIFLKRTINAVIYKAHKLPFKYKIKTARIFIYNYLKYINIKSILILFLKK